MNEKDEENELGSGDLPDLDDRPCTRLFVMNEHVELASYRK